ncbi:hypothetical protein EBT31_11840 [bacterium]|nr:hypothetical protein [bacterium]NBX50119.1 hypothetical protein [bacterium]
MSIGETIGENQTKGYIVTISGTAGKKQINESDFFPDGSEIESKIQQLRKLLRQYFDANQ